ncbi:MAG: branched-chain amino acid ABC transporter permease [Anaerolineales bacterium]|nr:branched-chain amino acid ABC transporter permease [Anaerolineales bacterium]
MAILRPPGDFDRTYVQDMSILRLPWHVWGTILALLALFIVPQLDHILPESVYHPSTHAYVVSTMNQIAYTVIALQGINILTGFTGQISLGQAAFMLVGGYVSALAMIHWSLPFYLAIPIAGLGTGLFGLIFGLPSLRVKGFYLAMATLAAQFIIPWLTRNIFKDYLGGTSGAIEIPVPAFLGDAVNFAEVSNFVYISLVVLIITTIMTNNIGRTRLGRAFISIRDNDLAAELLGINLFGYKLRAFFIAALLAGVAGALKATGQRAVGTELGYSLEESVIFLGMLVIGGLGTNLGPFFGAIFVILLDDASLAIGEYLAHVFPDQAGALQTSFRPIFFGLMLMLFLIFEPRGLAHRWMLIKASWRLRPFAR